jgi:Tol biopolymer transport system component/DNA-binding winged helix-turn-helix (wHTH) protein
MPAQLIKFGLFELNLANRQLHKQGRRVRLQEQPLRVLEVLLEEPGKLVTRQELRQRLWPSDVYVDFDIGLNGAMKRLRLALSDSSDNPIFIETVTKSGYRFIAPVQALDAPAVAAGPADNQSPSSDGSDLQRQPGATAADPPPAHRLASPAKMRRSNLWAATFLTAVVLLTGYLLRPLAPVLQVTHVSKLSHSGHAFAGENLLSDGARLYYTEATVGKFLPFREILLNGNEDIPVNGLPPELRIRGLSPDHTTFLGVSHSPADPDVSSVWMVPVVGGQARRVGEFITSEPVWSPDGRFLAFGRANQLFLVGADGTGTRLLATVPGELSYPRWSPDGRRLRFTVIDIKSQFAIWEVSADGNDLHPLQFNSPGGPMEGYGDWTADGSFFVFTSRREGSSNLWAVADKSDWLHRGRREPVQLTAGPIDFYRPLPSLDSTRIFALGHLPAGELLRYDATQKEFVQFLGGRSADHLDFSHDAQWVAYIAYPEGTLWRARSDGTQPLQLTFPPMRALNPRWSPDGSRILFVVRRTGEVPKLYTISPDGGAPQLLLSDSRAQSSTSWSADGKFVIYGHDPNADTQDIFLYRLELLSGRTARIPGTQGLWAALCSPDGRYLVAQSITDDHLLVLLDLKTGERSALTKRKADYPAWSADSQYVYFNTFNFSAGGPPALYRVRVPGGKEEKIVDLQFLVAGIYGYWSGLALDGSPLVLRNRSATDVYALSVSVH